MEIIFDKFGKSKTNPQNTYLLQQQQQRLPKDYLPSFMLNLIALIKGFSILQHTTWYNVQSETQECKTHKSEPSGIFARCRKYLMTYCGIFPSGRVHRHAILQ